MTLDEYASTLLPININDDDIKINQFGLVTGDMDDYFAVLVEGNKVRLMPGPEFGPRLYRGQNCFYDNCKASIFRNKEYAKYILNKIKLFEFIKLISSNPIVKKMQNFRIMEHNLSIDFEGLAQHYELYTDMLDFTRSRDIAMFFALCRKNDVTNQYEPILDETAEAVVYTLDINKMINNKEGLNIIGFQPLVRPYKQKAFSIRQNINDNLNLKDYISYENIRINKAQSKKYCEMFEGGARLFPKDIVDEKAYILKTSKEIDNKVVEHMFRRNMFPDNIKNEIDLIRLLKNDKINIFDKITELSFTPNEISVIEKSWLEIEKDFMPKIKRRLCADHYQS